MSLFESRERRQIRKIRQALDTFVAAMIRLHGRTWYVANGKPLRSLIVQLEGYLEALIADLVKIERELRVGHVDWDRVKAANSSFRGPETTDRGDRSEPEGHQAGAGSGPGKQVPGRAGNGHARAP